MTKALRIAITALAVVLPLSLPFAASADEIYHREQIQEHRIHEGYRDGQLSRWEFERLRAREASINAERVRDLRRNGGYLTPGERANLNYRENHVSDSIYYERHDGR